MTQKSKRSLLSRANVLVRRIHLYAGLFMLPWVFLYGITGAMYNHQGLLPEVTTTTVPAEKLTDTRLRDFPTPAVLAQQVVDALAATAPDAKVSLPEDHGAEFNNDVILEVNADGTKHAVHVDPVSRSADVVALAEKETLQPLLRKVRNVTLTDNPYAMVRESIDDIMSSAGIEDHDPPKPRGWCKLNFVATVDGEPARVTYVLRDGHVDITRHTGDDGMTTRGFFMRLHTSHGQPPHWNGRMLWSIILDAMAIAMVTWGISGLIMWWQLKRTRLIGGMVIVASISFAAVAYFSMVQFYATTKL